MFPVQRLFFCLEMCLSTPETAFPLKTVPSCRPFLCRQWCPSCTSWMLHGLSPWPLGLGFCSLVTIQEKLCQYLLLCLHPRMLYLMILRVLSNQNDSMVPGERETLLLTRTICRQLHLHQLGIGGMFGRGDCGSSEAQIMPWRCAGAFGRRLSREASSRCSNQPQVVLVLPCSLVWSEQSKRWKWTLMITFSCRKIQMDRSFSCDALQPGTWDTAAELGWFLFSLSKQKKGYKLRRNNKEGVTKRERLDLNWYKTQELACSPVNIGMTLPELKKNLTNC